VELHAYLVQCGGGSGAGPGHVHTGQPVKNVCDISRQAFALSATGLNVQPGSGALAPGEGVLAALEVNRCRFRMPGPAHWHRIPTGQVV
jgi:hypothetical protein